MTGATMRFTTMHIIPPIGGSMVGLTAIVSGLMAVTVQDSVASILYVAMAVAGGAWVIWDQFTRKTIEHRRQKLIAEREYEEANKELFSEKIRVMMIEIESNRHSLGELRKEVASLQDDLQTARIQYAKLLDKHADVTAKLTAGRFERVRQIDELQSQLDEARQRIVQLERKSGDEIPNA